MDSGGAHEDPTLAVPTRNQPADVNPPTIIGWGPGINGSRLFALRVGGTIP